MDTTTLSRPADRQRFARGHAPALRPDPVLRIGPRPARSPVARTRRGPRLGAAGAPRTAAGHRRALPLGPRRQRLGQLLLLRGRRRPGRSRGRRSSSAPATRPTRSPSTRRRWRCGRWPSRCGSSVSPAGASWCPRPSWASPPSGCCTTSSVVRRARAAAGLIAGAVMALTPVAVLMFRFNNPDALLTLLMVGAAARDPARHRGDRGRRRGTTRPPRALAGPRRRPRRAGLPDQDAAGVPGAPGPRARLPALRAAPRGAGASATCSSRSARCCSPAAGGSRSSSCGRPSSRPYIGGSQTTPSSS